MKEDDILTRALTAKTIRTNVGQFTNTGNMILGPYTIYINALYDIQHEVQSRTSYVTFRLLRMTESYSK